MRKALILQDGDGVRRVREIFETTPSLTPEVAAELQEVAPEVQVGWIEDPAHGLIPPQPDAPGVFVWDGAAWQLDEAATDQLNEGRAIAALNTPQNRVLLEVLWDLEARLRLLGSDSTIVEIDLAVDKPAYKAAVKGLIKDQL